MEERRTIGERLLERIDRRADGHVRPATTQAYEDRYSRFARTRGMSRLGLSLFPDAADSFAAPVANAADTSDPTFLSGVPFWARMRRIGAARLRRQQWLSGLGSKFGQRSLKTRKTPQTSSFSSLFGLESLSMDSLVLLEPEQTADAEAQAEGASGPGEAGGSSAWFTGSSFVPAPVIKGMRGGRPMQRAEARAPSPTIIQKVVQQVVRAAKEGRPEVTIEEIPAAIAAKVRRAVRRQARRLGVTQADADAAMPDEFASPATMAAGRAPARRGGKKRGLRTMAASSPMMSELSAESQPQVAQAGTAVIERTAHREPTTKTGRTLSASPVGRPSPTRRIVREQPAEAMAVEGVQPAHGSDQVTAALSSTAAIGLTQPEAAESASIAAADRIGQPVGRSGTARRARASYTSDPTVLVPDGVTPVEDEVSVQDAAPRSVKPGAPVIRSTARVAQRAVAALEAGSPRRTAHRSVSVPMAAESTENKPVRRASVASRAPDGRFVSMDTQSADTSPEVASEVSAQAQSATSRMVAKKTASATREQGDSPYAAAEVGASYAAARLEHAEAQADTADESVRSLIPKVVPTRRTADALVLPIPEDGAEESVQSVESVESVGSARALPKSSPGARAAARVSRTPVVGYTAARTASPAPRKAASTGSRPRREGVVSYAAPAPETVTISVPMDASAQPADEAATASVQGERAVRAARATHGKSRPLDWSGARVELVAPESVAAPGTRSARARARTTQTGAFVSSRVAEQSSRRPRVEAPSQMVLPVTQAEQDPAADLDPPADRRVGFDHTVQGVGTGRVDTEMPIWAQRATGAPRIRGSEDLVGALAKAGKPDEVVQVLMERSSEMSTVASALPTPVIQVINQIQTEAGKVAEDMAASQAPTEAAGRARPSDRGQVRSSARVIRGMTGLRPSTGAKSSGGGVQKVTALAQRLQQLIDMAEKNRDSARREVRMAEDSSAARAEGSAAPAAVEATQDSSVDVDALAQQVTDAVTRELEMRQERRLDDPTGRSIWWE